MSTTAVDLRGYDPLRDVRHKDARSARDQADWLAWLELGGIRPRTIRDYEWATARLLRAMLFEVQSYKRGCRCDACRHGNRDYQRQRKAAADLAYERLATCFTCGGPFDPWAYGKPRQHCRACELVGAVS